MAEDHTDEVRGNGHARGGRLTVDSFDSQVLALQPGGSVAKCNEVDAKQRPMSEISPQLPRLRKHMSNTLGPPIARAKLRTGGKYKRYVGQVTMADGSIFTVGIVRRET